MARSLPPRRPQRSRDRQDSLNRPSRRKGKQKRSKSIPLARKILLGVAVVAVLAIGGYAFSTALPGMRRSAAVLAANDSYEKIEADYYKVVEVQAQYLRQDGELPITFEQIAEAQERLVYRWIRLGPAPRDDANHIATSMRTKGFAKGEALGKEIGLEVLQRPTEQILPKQREFEDKLARIDLIMWIHNSLLTLMSPIKEGTTPVGIAYSDIESELQGLSQDLAIALLSDAPASARGTLQRTTARLRSLIRRRNELILQAPPEPEPERTSSGAPIVVHRLPINTKIHLTNFGYSSRFGLCQLLSSKLTQRLPDDTAYASAHRDFVKVREEMDAKPQKPEPTPAATPAVVESRDFAPRFRPPNSPTQMSPPAQIAESVKPAATAPEVVGTPDRAPGPSRFEPPVPIPFTNVRTPFGIPPVGQPDMEFVPPTGIPRPLELGTSQSSGPATGKVRTSRPATRPEAIAALEQLRDALEKYYLDKGHLPPAGSGPEFKEGLSWRVHLLPYLDEAELYAKFRLDEPWDSPHNSSLASQRPNVFRGRDAMASDKTTTHVFVDAGALFNSERPIPDQLAADESGRMMLVTTGFRYQVCWTQPGGLLAQAKTTDGLLGSPPDRLCAMEDFGTPVEISGSVPLSDLLALVSQRGHKRPDFLKPVSR